MRALKIKGLGRNYSDLKDNFLKYYHNKIERNQLLQRLILIGIGSCISFFLFIKL